VYEALSYLKNSEKRRVGRQRGRKPQRRPSPQNVSEFLRLEVLFLSHSLRAERLQEDASVFVLLCQ
jgi:hypothetical protein